MTNTKSYLVRTKAQIIWKYGKLKLPKVINTDIGWQLMFGEAENPELDIRKERENCEQYYTKIYTKEEIIKLLK